MGTTLRYACAYSFARVYNRVVPEIFGCLEVTKDWM
jgi:hypothetical protein